FADLLGLRLARELRVTHGFASVKAARIVREMVHRFGPLGAASSEVWVEANRRLYVQPEDGSDPLELDKGGQHAMRSVVRHVSRHVDLNSKGEAVRWYPDGPDSTVVVDPGVRWGDAVILGTRVPTSVLYRAWLESGADIDAYRIVSEEFEVTT